MIRKFDWVLRSMICCALVLGAVATCSARLPMSEFGNHWVQTHKFQIMNYCVRKFLISPSTPVAADFKPELSKLLNIGTTGFIAYVPEVLDVTAHAGMTSHSEIIVTYEDVRGNTIVPSALDRIKSYMKPDYGDAWDCSDEPTEIDFHALSVVAEWLKTNTPNALIYNNIAFTGR